MTRAAWHACDLRYLSLEDATLPPVSGNTSDVRGWNELVHVASHSFQLAVQGAVAVLMTIAVASQMEMIS